MIDAPTTLMLMGVALQAVPPARALIATIRRRQPNARERQRCLDYTPLPRRDRALEQLVIIADTALLD